MKFRALLWRNRQAIRYPGSTWPPYLTLFNSLHFSLFCSLLSSDWVILCEDRPMDLKTSLVHFSLISYETDSSTSLPLSRWKPYQRRRFWNGEQALVQSASERRDITQSGSLCRQNIPGFYQSNQSLSCCWDKLCVQPGNNFQHLI